MSIPEDTKGRVHDYGYGGHGVQIGANMGCASCREAVSTKATFTLESLKNAARNLRVAFDAGFEVICDESTVGLNEWAVSEIERLHRAFDGMSARYDDAEAEVKRLRGEMNRLKSLFTDSRHILGKCGAHHCEPGCKATWVTYV